MYIYVAVSEVVWYEETVSGCFSILLGRVVFHTNNSSDSLACTSLVICISHLLASPIFLLTVAVWLELSVKQCLINKIALIVCCFTYYLTSALIHYSQTVGDLVFQTTII
jgi:hypothetical protein